MQVYLYRYLAPCTKLKTLWFKIVVDLKISCNFELEFYDDRLVSIAAKIAKSKAEEDANLICTPIKVFEIIKHWILAVWQI